MEAYSWHHQGGLDCHSPLVDADMLIASAAFSAEPASTSAVGWTPMQIFGHKCKLSRFCVRGAQKSYRDLTGKVWHGLRSKPSRC